jgi:BMFP domain-containing protein YqiC
MKKLIFALALFLLVGINFVSSANYPAPLVSNGNGESEITSLSKVSELEGRIEELEEDLYNRKRAEYKYVESSNKFHLGDGTNMIINCSEIGKTANNTYCNGKEFVEKKSWANPCESDYECISGLCLDNKCSRLSKENYTIQQLEIKTKDLENRLNKLESQTNSSQENNSNNFLTGKIVDDSLNKESWVKKIWKMLFK